MPPGFEKPTIGGHGGSDGDPVHASRSHSLDVTRRCSRKTFDAEGPRIPASPASSLTGGAIRSKHGTHRGLATVLDRLLAHPHDGGFGLRESDVRVIQQRRQVEELNAAAERLRTEHEHAIAQWTPASQVLSRVEAWLKSPPLGTVLEDAPEPKVALQKGEDLLAGVDRLRRRAGELNTELARIAAAPMPSAHCKRRVRETVEALAVVGGYSMSLMKDLLQRPFDQAITSKYTAMNGLIYLGLGAVLLIWPGVVQTIFRDAAFVGNEAALFRIVGMNLMVIGWLYLFGGLSGGRRIVAASVFDRVVLVPLVLVPLAIAGVFPHTLLAVAALDPTLALGAWLLLRSDGPRFRSTAGTPSL